MNKQDVKDTARTIGVGLIVMAGLGVVVVAVWWWTHSPPAFIYSRWFIYPFLAVVACAFAYGIGRAYLIDRAERRLDREAEAMHQLKLSAPVTIENTHKRKAPPDLSPEFPVWQAKEIADELEQARVHLSYVHGVMPTTALGLNEEFEAIYRSIMHISSVSGDFYLRGGYEKVIKR